MSKIEEYRTSDMYLVAYLRVAKVPFLRKERDEKGRVTFIFENVGDAIRDLKAQYYGRTAKVPALDFADEIRAVKALIHEN